MSLTLLDIYNKVTGQSWSLYETEITDFEEVDKSVIISIQKALRMLWNAYPYTFRLKNKKINLLPNQGQYYKPDGNIVDKGVKLLETGEILKPKMFNDVIDERVGKPEYFYIKYNKLNFYPIPDKNYTVSIDYNTFKMGLTTKGEAVYNLNNPDDTLNIPEIYEDLFLHTLINKSMLNALASGRSELYQAYLSQFIETYRDLLTTTSGLDIGMEIKW